MSSSDPQNIPQHDLLLFLDSIVENIPHMIFVKSADELRFVRFNKAGEALLGYSREDLLGKNDYDFFPREQADFFTQKDREVLDGRCLVDIPEEPLQSRDGLRYLHTRKIPILDDKGKPVYLLGISEDISEIRSIRLELQQAHSELEMRVRERTAELSRMNEDLKSEMQFRERSEHARRESDRQLITLLSNLPGMAYRCLNDRDWTMEFISSGCLELTGYEPEDLIFNRRLSYNDIIHPDDQELVWQTVQKAVGKRQAYTMEYRIQNKAGEERWVWEKGIGIFSESGLLLALEGFISDITERVRSQQEARRRREEQQIILDTVPAMIWYKDPDGRILRCNKLAAKSRNMTVAQMEGRLTSEVFSAYAAKYHQDDLEVIHSGKPKRDIIEKLELEEGHEAWVRTDKIPYRDHQGNIIGVIVFSVDITEQRWAEEELKKLTSELSRSNRELEQFAFVASHDLKEPVRKIENFAAMLSQEDLNRLSPTARDYIYRMRKSTRRMATLIEDLLEYSRVSLDDKVFEAVSLDDIVDHAIADLELIIKKSQARIQHDSLPVLQGNAMQLHQLFLNLFSNSLKFVEPGKAPDIQVRCKGTGEGMACIEVRDQGIGFDKKYAERIFLPFERLHQREKFEGTGIGLAICKKILDNHRGSIQAISQPGQGTVFQINLPLAPD